MKNLKEAWQKVWYDPEANKVSNWQEALALGVMIISVAVVTVLLILLAVELEFLLQ